MRDYQFVSPSIEGILSHSSVLYEGVARPTEILRIFDRPSLTSSDAPHSDEERKILGQYFQDLYSVFLKKLSAFALESEYSTSECLKLQAMLQEMIKVKRLMGQGK